MTLEELKNTMTRTIATSYDINKISDSDDLMLPHIGLKLYPLFTWIFNLQCSQTEASLPTVLQRSKFTDQLFIIILLIILLLLLFYHNIQVSDKKTTLLSNLQNIQSYQVKKTSNPS